MKICKHCGFPKPTSDFSAHPKTKDKLQTWCRECKRKDGNPQRDEVKRKVKEYKEIHGCYHCGERNSEILDFHHVDGKDFSLDLAHSKHWTVMLKEIERCIVLCKSCHSKEHGRLKRLLKKPALAVDNWPKTVDKSNKYVDKLLIC